MTKIKKIETPEDENASLTREDLEESKVVSEKTKDLSDDDEARLRSCEPKGRFIVVQLKGDNRFRVVSKTRKWVSPVIDYTKATRLAVAFNRKDPEQKKINASVVRKEGGVNVSGWQEN